MKFFLFLTLFFSIAQVQAQDVVDTQISPEQIIHKESDVDVKPEFPGGIEDCYKYFTKRIILPNVSGLVEKVVLTFVVETDGTLTDIRIIHDAGFGTSDQVATILEAGPKWIPGMKDNKKVRVAQRLPIPIVTNE